MKLRHLYGLYYPDGIMRRRRILFVSIEFAASTFSGNGVLAMSQVTALHQLGHEVLVLSGKPQHDDGKPRATTLPAELRVLEVELPVWGRLDARCSWSEFAAGCSGRDVVAEVADFRPEVVIGVDWHSAIAYEQLRPKLQTCSPTFNAVYIYLNYRVYSRTANNEDVDFIRRAEAAGVKMSSASVALSKSDAKYIEDHLSPPQMTEGVSLQGLSEPPRVLLPSLRSDMMVIPMPTSDTERPYITCCVRLSPEKEPERFVELMVELKRRGTLRTYGLTPLFIAAGNSPYAEDSFIGPQELAEIAAATRLNIHPCLYDAYGMTVVEMASQGAPSIINGGGAVGATELLAGDAKESFEVDMSQGGTARLADHVEAILSNLAHLSEVSAAAAKKARSWGALENARALMTLLE